MDYNWHQQLSEDIKILVVKKKKSKSTIIEKKDSTILLFTKKGKRKKRCKEYGLARHIEKSCYYRIQANQRLVDWKLYYSKEYRL